MRLDASLAELGFSSSCAFFGLDAIGAEVEDPFGIDPNGLSLNASSRNIAIDVPRMIGEKGAPAPLKPENNLPP